MKQNELLVYAIDALDSLSIPYFLVGSLASSAYGEGRMTNDIDIVVDLKGSQVEALCRGFPSPAFYVSLTAANEAIRQRSQFNVIHPQAGQKIDFMIARADAWGREQMARRRRERIFPELEGFIAAPEDVIIGKLIYYHEGESEKHLRDIASMLKLSTVPIDKTYIEHWAGELGITAAWQAVLSRLGGC